MGPGVGPPRGHSLATEAAAGAARGTHQLFRAGFVAVFLFRPVSADNRAGDRTASHELFFSSLRVFFLSSVNGLSGGPRLDSRGFRDLLRCFNSAAGELSEIGCRDARCVAGGGAGAICVSGAVLLRILL